MIFAGNQYLADFAKKYNKNVIVIPTTIDTRYYVRKTVDKTNTQLCIGWTGSSTTLKHFGLAIPFLKILKAKYNDKIYFRLISDKSFYDSTLQIKFTRWDKQTEIADLCMIDIGIMPLPDDDWAKGKCGFKGLQYMALEIPAVMSPVGVNKDIISDGENGFLAKNQDEWIEKISLLIESRSLRKEIGKKGRETVMQSYSFESQKDRYLAYFNELSGN
jgi:glycosyltransferase involved in cell wall biosynthesis